MTAVVDKKAAARALKQAFGKRPGVAAMRLANRDMQRFNEWLASSNSLQAALDAFREEMQDECDTPEEASARLEMVARVMEVVNAHRKELH